MRPSFEDLEAALDHIRAAPKTAGTIELIARRPALGTREVIDRARFSFQLGLVGDGWPRRASKKTGAPDPDQQITLMGTRAIAAIAAHRQVRAVTEVPGRDGWLGAGDQLFVDFDFSEDNCPPGTELEVGTAVLRVSAQPHRGCAKFTTRFGSDVTRWVNSDVGRQLNLRGVNAQVIVEGEVRRGDLLRRR